ncbi:hypothetical protein [Vibrio sp. Y29_XK_CS5]|uniref:hypothetical protein n=1 Tax=Vibrio TaxID=662 RepID=UPI0020A442D6|nr:hypothetical protein [Vibrio sp. Y29_XK_CS5]
MTSHDFLFTYSVSPLDGSKDEHKKAADTVRRRIAELERWEKLVSVETTFVGRLNLIETLISSKRREAKGDVTYAIELILDDLEVSSFVTIDIALLVDGLGEYMEFRI